MILTLRHTIPSGSHNSAYSEEHGHHWPAGQKFKLLPKGRQESARRYYRIKSDRVVVEQVGGEEVLLAVPRDKFEYLFGVQP